MVVEVRCARTIDAEESSATDREDSKDAQIDERQVVDNLTGVTDRY